MTVYEKKVSAAPRFSSPTHSDIQVYAQRRSLRTQKPSTTSFGKSLQNQRRGGGWLSSISSSFSSISLRSKSKSPSPISKWDLKSASKSLLSMTQSSTGSAATWVLLVSWIVSAVIGTIVNKRVMKEFPFPIAFTALHLLIGGLMDYLIVLRSKSSAFSLRKEHFVACSWNGLWFALSKYLTYVSYGKVPLSLTHTVKSSGPVFVVAVNALYFSHCRKRSAAKKQHTRYSAIDTDSANDSDGSSHGHGHSNDDEVNTKWPASNELLTLVPITVGVTMSAVHEINFELIGFLSAVLATLLGVFQNVTSKATLSRYRGVISPMELHMYGSMLALMFLLPLAAFSEGPKLAVSLWNSQSSFVAAAKKSTGMKPLALAATVGEHQSHPVAAILFSVVCLYAQTMASLFLLKRVTTVTHQVANTSKRFFIIVTSVLYFRNEVSIWNACGISLALTGFFSYQRCHKKNEERKKRRRLYDKRMKWRNGDIEAGASGVMLEERSILGQVIETSDSSTLLRKASGSMQSNTTSASVSAVASESPPAAVSVESATRRHTKRAVERSSRQRHIHHASTERRPLATMTMTELTGVS